MRLRSGFALPPPHPTPRRPLQTNPAESHADHAKGFEAIPRRWVIERTFAWLGRCRRLAKDFENLTRNALAFIRLASIRLMMRKLCLTA